MDESFIDWISYLIIYTFFSIGCPISTKVSIYVQS